MAKMTEQMLLERADQMFSLQRPLLGLFQTLAENFYPERADFLAIRSLGTELADTLVDSYPVIVRRDLGNSFASMLRDGDWFGMGLSNGQPDYSGKQWLQESTQRMRRMFNARVSNFDRSTREGDHDFATFGQCVISVEPNMRQGGLLFRNWHLRDCAWFDDDTGQVCGVARKWEPTRYDLVRIFGKDRLPAQVVQKFDREPLGTEQYYHMVLPTDMYGDEELLDRDIPYVSIFIDRINRMVVEAKGINYKYYVIPRFHTISGSPYAFSPAAAVGLADARTLQAMTHTLLETAERYARPPMVATAQAITGVVDLAPDGITWVDDEYDERKGAALRPIAQDRGGFPIGQSERERVTALLTEAFYLDKLNLPATSKEMTAYEVQERMKQYRRQVLPLFSPIETDYNGQVCEAAFDLMLQYGMFGSPRDIPRSLQGQDVNFQFVSPLTASEQDERVNKFQRTTQLLAEAATVDPTVYADVDISTAMRDAISSFAPSSWLFDPKVAQESKLAMAAQQMQQQQAEVAGAAA